MKKNAILYLIFFSCLFCCCKHDVIDINGRNCCKCPDYSCRLAKKLIKSIIRCKDENGEERRIYIGDAYIVTRYRIKIHSSKLKKFKKDIKISGYVERTAYVIEGTYACMSEPNTCIISPKIAESILKESPHASDLLALDYDFLSYDEDLECYIETMVFVCIYD